MSKEQKNAYSYDGRGMNDGNSPYRERIATFVPGLADQDSHGHLWAAAPDMLAALELVYANAAESPEWIRERLWPVIARAKGDA